MPLPIQSWQIWNEPNLQKYFDPGGTSGQGINKYAQLVKISHDAIKSKDPQARIVLAGSPGYPRQRRGLKAWDFLNGLYEVPGFKDYFDVAALHPYAGNLDGFRRQILEFRGVMTNHGDQRHAAVADRVRLGIGTPRPLRHQQGPRGSGADTLRTPSRCSWPTASAWNVQRLYWFLWRDPPPRQGVARRCSFCDSGGLLRNGGAPKPAYSRFRGFTAETIPPQARITAGPSHGGFTNDSTPSFSLASNEAGSTFVCRFDRRPFRRCGSPYTLPQLPDGGHTLLRQGDRCSRKREPGRVALVHGRHGPPGCGDLLRSGGRRDLVQSEPLLPLRLQRLPRQPQLPTRRRRLCRLRLAVHRLRPRRRPAHVPGEGDGSGPEHPHRLT